MDEASIISLIAVACVAIFSSVTAPLILAHRTERMHREDQLTDYQRQDLMAREAKKATIAMAAQQDMIIRQQRDATEAARVRDEAARRLAAATARSTDDKLDVIHKLVNSTLSAALAAELDALVTSLAMMGEVANLKKAAGQGPSGESDVAIRSTEAKIAEIRATLADRAAQAEAIAGDAARMAASAEDAAKSAAETAKPLMRPWPRQGGPT